MDRNGLKAAKGDSMHATRCAAGLTLRLLLGPIAAFLRLDIRTEFFRADCQALAENFVPVSFLVC